MRCRRIRSPSDTAGCLVNTAFIVCSRDGKLARKNLGFQVPQNHKRPISWFLKVFYSFCNLIEIILLSYFNRDRHVIHSAKTCVYFVIPGS